MKDDETYMQHAIDQAKKALAAGEFPVGCVLIYKGRVLSTGYRTGTFGKARNEIDHAELIALRRLNAIDPKIPRNQIRLFCTMEPCLMCFGAILIYGIGEIVYAYEDVMGGGTSCNLSQLSPLYKDRSISIIPHIRRQESLELFKTYFANPQNHYWKDSLLATYTLNQK